MRVWEELKSLGRVVEAYENIFLDVVMDCFYYVIQAGRYVFAFLSALAILCMKVALIVF